MFISFEGLDGSGKTTVIKMVEEFLVNKGLKVLLTREPGAKDSKEALKIREIILNPENELDDMTEAVLYAADRSLHLKRTILPALKENTVILCDRYIDSSLAYQGKARGLGIDRVKKLNDAVTNNTYPDLTLLLRIPPKLSFERTIKRNGVKDRLEEEGLKFREDIYLGYEELLKMFPERIKVIDATKNIETVYKEVISKLEFIFN